MSNSIKTPQDGKAGYSSYMDAYFDKIKEIEQQNKLNELARFNDEQKVCQEQKIHQEPKHEVRSQHWDTTDMPVAGMSKEYVTAYKFGTPNFSQFIGQKSCYNKPKYYKPRGGVKSI